MISFCFFYTISFTIYQLQCTECNAFYIEETRRSLSNHMNGHWFTTMVSNPDLPVAIHIQSHQIPFQECWSVKYHTGTTRLHPRQHPPPIWNCIPTRPPIPTHPVSTSINPTNSTLAPAESFDCLFYSTAQEGHSDLAESLHFRFVSSPYVLATLARGTDDALICLR